MRSYPLPEAQADLSKIMDRALSGEPQRVTRHGQEAVVIISEAEWSQRAKGASTLADLFLRHAGDGLDDGYAFLGAERPWKEERDLGSDFLSDEQA